MDDEYFFQFVVGPPLEYLLAITQQEVEETVIESQMPRPKPKGRTMWDLPDPFLPKKEKD